MEFYTVVIRKPCSSGISSQLITAYCETDIEISHERVCVLIFPTAEQAQVELVLTLHFGTEGISIEQGLAVACDVVHVEFMLCGFHVHWPKNKPSIPAVVIDCTDYGDPKVQLSGRDLSYVC